MTIPHSPPGWYPDPSGKPGNLYWDGQAWVAPPASPPNYPMQQQTVGTAGGGILIWRNVMIVLGCIAAIAWLGYGFSHTSLGGVDCGTVMSPNPMPDKYSKVACAEALDSHAGHTGVIAIVAFVCFAVALTIHLTNKRKG